ncbi:MAG: DUF4383 domain-containing protein [Bdellovibrionota bacterium]
MATTMKSTGHRHTRAAFATRSSIQKACIVLGAGFVLVGLAGIIMPGLMSMHLSWAHNLIHLVSGALALSFGYADDSRKAYTFAVAFGVVYGLLGVAGFVIGQPGYPGVGHMAADQNLLRVIPNILEFGTMDHSIHLILSAAFLGAAYVWKKNHLEADRSIVDVQRRSLKPGVLGEETITSFETFDSSDSASDLSKADLGASDISRIRDQERRANLEKHL